jgi:hypothetical protein
MADEPQTERRTDIIPTFAHLITTIEKGNLHHDLNFQLGEVVKELEDYAKAFHGTKPKGRITLVLDLQKDGENMRITGSIATKTPPSPRASDIFWTTADGKLASSNPRQMALPLKAVAQVATENKAL